MNCGVQAGTATGRAIGSIVGANLAAYTAELGGKVRYRTISPLPPHYIVFLKYL